ncbi:hypothetical protein D3C85_1564010 [compost metagenome]
MDGEWSGRIFFDIKESFSIQIYLPLAVVVTNSKARIRIQDHFCTVVQDDCFPFGNTGGYSSLIKMGCLDWFDKTVDLRYRKVLMI